MFCNTNQFPSLPFCGPHTKPHGVRGLSKHYHRLFDPKQVHVICAMRRITCACYEFTSMLDKSWITGLAPKQQPCYQPVTNWSYWPVLSSFNNWNIIIFSHKATTSEALEEIHQVLLDGISDNMASLIKSGKFGNMNKKDTSTMGYYVIKFFSEAYTLQEDITCDGKIISAVELVVGSKYLSCVQ